MRESFSGPGFDLAVVGHVNLDRFLFAAELPKLDRTVPLRGQSVHLGGTATNIVRAAARVGLSTALVSAVGPDFPSEFRAILEQEGVDLSGLTVDPTTPCSTCFVVEDGRGGQMTLIDQGPLADGRRPTFEGAAVRAARFTHLTTGPPEPMLRLARDRPGGTRIAVDPAQEIHYRWDPRAFRELLDGAEILFGNRAELATAARLGGVSSPRGLLDRVPLLVGTLGPAGAIAYSRRGTERVPGRRIRRLRQVTGAGDAFRGGFYGGWVRGEPLRRCLTRGIGSAAHWISGGGSLGDGGAARTRGPRR